MTVMTSLQKLLKYPHRAVFDVSAHAELVLQIRHPGGLVWEIADGVMTITAGGADFEYDLEQHTVGTLRAALVADGIEATQVAPSFAGHSAMVLIETRGDQDKSNGDQLGGFRSYLWAIYSAYAREIRQQAYQVQQALRQMVMTQAEGEWLDLWGMLYDQSRDGQSDAEFQERIPREAFRLRVNALAIEQAILDQTGKDVIIEEPWRYIFRLDDSKLSGDHRFYDGTTVGYHLIRPVSRVSIDWTDVFPVIERNRAAGVIVLPPEVLSTGFIDATVDGTCSFATQTSFGDFIQIWTDSRLDYMVLSDEEITRNWAVMISHINTYSNAEGLLDPETISSRRTIAKASIVLSEAPPLGDENAIFPRAEMTHESRLMSLSVDAELSSIEHKQSYRPVDEVTLQTNQRGVLDLGSPASIESMPPQQGYAYFGNLQVLGELSHIQQQTHGRLINLGLSPAFSTRTSTASGYTWAEAGEWGEFPWALSQYELETLEAEASRILRYAQYDLPEDLS